MKTWYALFLCALLLSGCGDMPTSTAEDESEPESVATEETSSTAVENKQPEVQADFASVKEALEVLSKATAAQARSQQTAAVAWLGKQGRSAVGPLTSAVKDTSANTEYRRMACMALGRNGPPAVPGLIEASRVDELAVRLKAIEMLGTVKPTQKEIVQQLMRLMDDSNDQVQRTAIRTLGSIGPAAKDSAKKLQNLRDNSNASETIRGEADRSLHLVRPIKTFND